MPTPSKMSEIKKEFIIMPSQEVKTLGNELTEQRTAETRGHAHVWESTLGREKVSDQVF